MNRDPSIDEGDRIEMSATRELRVEPVPPTFLERFVALFRSRLRLYAAVVVAAALVAAGISLMLPTWYRAEATLLPPTDTGESGFGMLEGVIQSSALSKLGFASTTSASDVFAEILKSRTLGVAAIEKYGLASLYHQKGMDRTLKEFQRHLAVGVNNAGVLSVSFEDRDPRRAADVTNDLVQGLDRFNVGTYKTKGKRLRMFLEGRLGEVQKQLAVAEERLQNYEHEHHVVSSGSESGESAHGVSDILAQKFNLQTQRDYVSSFTTPGNAERENIERQLTALNSEIAKLPEIKREGARLQLDLEVQRKLLVLMSAQYEDARMQETRDTPTVTVLDAATVPQIKSRPKRSLIVLGAAFAALLGCAGWTAASLRRER